MSESIAPEFAPLSAPPSPVREAPAPSSQPKWRLIVASVVLLVMAFVSLVLASIVAKVLGGHELLQGLVRSLVSLAVTTTALWLIAGRWLKLDLGDIGLRRQEGDGRRLLLGLGLGVGSALVAFAIAFLAGGYSIHGYGLEDTGWSAIAVLAVSTALFALTEEVAFRAGLVGILKQRFHPAVAVMVPGLLFSVAHLGNKGASALSALNVFIVGAALGFLYLAAPRASLALCTGFHFAWNEALHRMGVTVSGKTLAGNFMTVTSEPNVWSGYDFGLEASPATTLVVIALTALGYTLYRQYRSPASDPQTTQAPA